VLFLEEDRPWPSGWSLLGEVKGAGGEGHRRKGTSRSNGEVPFGRSSRAELNA